MKVNGYVAYDGDLEKGCGNQVFDYGKVIEIAKEGESSITTPTVDKVSLFSSVDTNCNSARDKEPLGPGSRCETRLMNHLDNPSLPRPKVDTSPPRSATKSARDVAETERRSGQEVKKSKEVRDSREKPRGTDVYIRINACSGLFVCSVL